jgi:hypothetical protein
MIATDLGIIEASCILGVEQVRELVTRRRAPTTGA